MPRKSTRNQKSLTKSRGNQSYLSDHQDFEETNPNGDLREIYLLKRQIYRLSPLTDGYRAVRDHAAGFDSGQGVLELDRKLEPVKGLFKHMGFQIGDKVWDACQGEDGLLHPRAGKWDADQLGSCDRERVGAITSTDREINPRFEAGVEHFNRHGGYNLVLRNSTHAAKRGLRNVLKCASIDAENGRGKVVLYEPSTQIPGLSTSFIKSISDPRLLDYGTANEYSTSANDRNMPGCSPLYYSSSTY